MTSCIVCLKTVVEETSILKHLDVVVLEYAPPRLRVEILGRGRVVVDRSPGLRALLLLHALDEVKALERIERLRENR